MTDLSPIFRRAHPAPPPLVPELRLHLGAELTPLWEELEQIAGSPQPPPYWAFAWAGGQALARYVLDHPHEVRGRRVLDIGAGSGLVALAAIRAGASSALAAEIDPHACAAIRANAALNGIEVETTCDDVIGGDGAGAEVVLAGDMFYEKPLAVRLDPWLRARRARGARVLLGDPGRNYFDGAGLTELAVYEVDVPYDLESRTRRTTRVWALP